MEQILTFRDFTGLLATLSHQRRSLLLIKEPVASGEARIGLTPALDQLIRAIDSGLTPDAALSEVGGGLGESVSALLRCAAAMENPLELYESLSKAAERRRRFLSLVRTLSLYPIVIILLAIFTFWLQFLTLFKPGGLFFSQLVRGATNPLTELALYHPIAMVLVSGILTAAVVWFFLGMNGLEKLPTGLILARRIPVVGKIVAMDMLAGFLDIFGKFLHAGIPAAEACRSAAGFMGNDLAKSDGIVMAKRLSQGENVSDVFSSTPFIPEQVYRQVVLAEKTNTLPETIADLAEFYDGERELMMPVVVQIFQNILAIVAGLFVAVVAINLFSNLFHVSYSPLVEWMP